MKSNLLVDQKGNKKMLLKSIFVTIFGLTTVIATFCQSLSVETSTGVLYGYTNELVYDNNTLMSKLTWPIQPITYASIGTEVEMPFSFLLSLQGQLGIPLSCGMMEDRDYLNLDGNVTNYSKSNAIIQSYIDLCGALGYQFRPLDSCLVTMLAGYVFTSYSWTASDGYYQYPPESSAPYSDWNSSWTKEPLYGTSVIYSQIYNYPFLDGGFIFDLTRTIHLSGQFRYSPFVTLYDNDEHLLRQLVFSETMTNGYLINPELQIAFDMTKQVSLAVSISYKQICGFQNGITSTEDETTGITTSNREYTDSSEFYSVGAEITLKYHCF